MYTIEKEIEYEVHIHKSRFIGNLHPVFSPEEAKDQIRQIGIKYREATHNCWAYTVGLRGETFHSSDAGEPPGTAGKPILTALQRSNLSNVVLIVTRYFGGVKLGIRGLIEAYRFIAEETIKKSRLKEMILKDYWEIITDYAQADKLKHALQEMNTEILSIDYQKEIIILATSKASTGLAEYLQNLQNAGLLIYKLLRTDF